MVERWFLPTISEILPPDGPSASAGPEAARQRWRWGLEALGQLLERQVTAADRDWTAAQGDLQDPDPPLHGLVLTGPSPLFHQPLLRSRFAHWTFSSAPSHSLWQLPARALCPRTAAAAAAPSPERSLALLPTDPLAGETFCLALTAQFSVLLVLGDRGGQPAFQFSFDPATISRILQALRGRIALTSRHHLDRLDLLFSQFAPVEPHYSLVMEFGQLLMQAVPVSAPRRAAQSPCQRSVGVAPTRLKSSLTGRRDRPERPSPKPPEKPPEPDANGPTAIDVQLLEAIAHGVRTPLATIRTLTRLMMKRRSLTADLRPFLEKIDLACTDQIERFDLIFKAVEMATARNSAPTPLAPTPLAEIFQHGIPRWQRQALQHNLDLKVELPPQLPMVHTDSALLDRMLTQLIEDLTRGLTAGSAIAMRVSMAGSQLKLQLHCQAAAPAVPLRMASGQQRIRSIGQVLTFQPETGNLGLNLKVTKNLFQSIGGKLIVRQRPEVGEVVTIFLPLERATGHGFAH
jgi:signal transduction histidine kinase